MSANFFWSAFAAVPSTFLKLLPAVGFNSAIVWVNQRIKTMGDEQFPNNPLLMYVGEGMTKTIEQAYTINIVGLEGTLPSAPVMASINY